MDDNRISAVLAGLTAGLSIGKACAEAGVSRAYWHELVAKDSVLADKYARAKLAGIEKLADELVDIADDGSNDWMSDNDPDNPGYRANGEHVQRSRLRVDTRKWVLAKLMPKKYGDRVEQHVTGDAAQPITIITRTIVDPPER